MHLTSGSAKHPFMYMYFEDGFASPNLTFSVHVETSTTQVGLHKKRASSDDFEALNIVITRPNTGHH